MQKHIAYESKTCTKTENKKDLGCWNVLDTPDSWVIAAKPLILARALWYLAPEDAVADGVDGVRGAAFVHREQGVVPPLHPADIYFFQVGDVEAFPRRESVHVAGCVC
jgi:hypothetical protein